MYDSTKKIKDLKKAIISCQKFISDNEGNPELEKMVVLYKDILKDHSDDYDRLLGK